jgi:hypothetical protein
MVRAHASREVSARPLSQPGRGAADQTCVRARAHFRRPKRSSALSFWEPRNADDFGHFRAHRDEAEHFAAAVSGGTPTFSFATYDELWRQWERPAPPPWLKTHVARLRTRYDIDI